MSILLEALRKSEKNQQAQEVPTIHSEDLSGQSSEPLNFLPMASMLIVALVVSGWFIWRQYEAPEGGYQPPVDLPPESSLAAAVPAQQASDGAAGKAGDQTGAQVGGKAAGGARNVNEATVNKPINKPANKPASKPASKPVSKSAGAKDKTVSGARTPVESFQKPQAAATQPPAPKAGTPAKKSPPGKTVASKKPQPKPKAGTPRKSVTAPAKKAKPSQPEPISYWELPDGIRASVPEIKFSVLVYSSKPPDRFVLINGQRLREGDSLPSGPVVDEIRRDGVVFKHRLYRFLVER